MSWEQVSNAIQFASFFTSAGAGKTGLTVTVTVYKPDRTAAVTAVAATEIGSGLYGYTLASGSTAAEGQYLAVFATTDTTVDAQQMVAEHLVGLAGVEVNDANISSRSSHTAANVRTEMDANSTKLANLDAQVSTRAPSSTALSTANWTTPRANALDNLDTTVGSRLAASGYTTPPTVGAIADGVWDEPLSGHATAGTTGAALAASPQLGSGAISFPYTVTDSATAQPIDGVDVVVTTGSASRSAGIVANGTTNGGGVVTFDLDPGTYYFWLQRNGYNFTNPDTEVVS